MDDEELFAKYWPDEDETPDNEDDPSPPPEEESSKPETLEQYETKKRLIPLTHYDLHNAEFLEFDFGKNVRYDHSTGEWFIWHKGQHYWALDGHEEIAELAKNAAKSRIAAAVDSKSSDRVKVAQALLSRAARQRALDDLRSFPGIGVGENHWNPSLDLFAVANGIIDLRNGALRPGRQDDEINKASPVRYDATAECPRWETFLKEVFVTDEMVEYVRTVIGYCLTGFTTEQVWFLLYGTGGNGKTVFVNILQSLFGMKQYYETAAGETFLINRWGPSGEHNITIFKKARLVVASEVPDRSMFNSSRIKELTGGDAVTASAKYGNPNTWQPQLKLMMLVNHLPSAHDDSEGFWRRIKTIPFDVSFIGRENPNLTNELREELPGILNWAVSGAVTWFQSGLAPEPAVATTLRKEYKEESDPLAQFVHECVVETMVESDTVGAREMYRIYASWSASAGHAPLNEMNFGRSGAMAVVGKGKKKTNTGTVYTGVKAYEPGVHQVSGVVQSD